MSYCLVPVLTSVRCQCVLDYATSASHLTRPLCCVITDSGYPTLEMSVYPATLLHTQRAHAQGATNADILSVRGVPSAYKFLKGGRGGGGG